MVNFHDPHVLLSDYLAFIKLCHTVDGLYLWEFVTTLNYEWRIIRGRYPYRWTIWIYTITRLATLMAVISDLLLVNMAVTNCQVWVTLGFIFGNLAITFASLLIVLRNIAIWNKNKFVAGLAAGLWVANVSSVILGITRIRGKWTPSQNACIAYTSKNTKFSSIVTLCTDIGLLLIMLVGLVRLCHPWGSGFRLGRLLWKQGITWLSLAIVAELTPTVFICLNLNNAFDLMFLPPSLIAMSVCATRMYRSLTDCGSADVIESSAGNPQRIDRAVSDANFVCTTGRSTPPNLIGLPVYISYEPWQHPSSQTDQWISDISTEGQQQEKPPGHNL